MNKTFSVFLACLLWMLSSVAGAANFSQHYSETILNFGSTLPEVQYIAIPRVGWPVHVQVSGVDVNIRPIVVTDFTVIDSAFAADNPTMTNPSIPPASGSVPGMSMTSLCWYPAPTPPASIECQITPEVSLGVTDVSSSQPHKMFIRFIQAPNQTQFRVTMWY